MRLAIYNFGLHVAPYDSGEVKGFRLREAVNFTAAERADGLIGRSGYDGEPGPASWGRQAFPRFIEGSGFETGPSSLSLWRDIESLMAFSYSGVHADALKNARHWNVKQQWPPLVLWWVEDGRLPDWVDGVARLENLHDHGPNPEAFHFKQAYDPAGAAYVVDRAVVRTLVEKNSAGQADLLASVKTMPV